VEVTISGKITSQFSPTVPLFATRISPVVVDVEVPGSECGNVKTGGGDRVSTISLLGCSTSVALAMGPIDKEEEEEEVSNHSQTSLLTAHPVATSNFWVFLVR